MWIMCIVSWRGWKTGSIHLRCFFYFAVAKTTTGFIDSDLPMAASDNGGQCAKKVLCRSGTPRQEGLNNLQPHQLRFSHSVTAGPRCSGCNNQYRPFQSVCISPVSTSNWALSHKSASVSRTQFSPMQKSKCTTKPYRYYICLLDYHY